MISKGKSDLKCIHYAGLPSALTGGEETRQKLGKAIFLVIEENQDGVFLYRYGSKGKFVGDTWHMNVDGAKYQASYEYADHAQEWVSVPAEVQDVVVFGLNEAESVE